LALTPADNLTGADPYRGWVLVPGPLPAAVPTTPAAAIPDGILTPGESRASIGDALKILRIAVNLIQATTNDLSHGDCAPLGPDGKPQPDGKIDLPDALVILCKAVGPIDW